MELLDPINLTMCFVVVVFWTTVALISRSRGRRVSANLAILPAFFLLVGLLLNRAHPHPPYGTYAVCVIHVMMLPALYKVAKSKP
jgi:hypothetical protein